MSTSLALRGREILLSSDLAALAYRLFVVALLCLALALATEAFLTTSNLLNVLRQASLVFLIASGLTLTILSAGIDLSVGANVGLSACLAATVMKATGSIALGVGTALASGSLVGISNGLLITWLRIPPFIATYGMLWVLHGITYWFMAGDTVHGFAPSFRAVGSGYAFGIPIPVYLMLGFLLVGGWFARYTTYGHEVYAIGANAQAARLSGVPVNARLNLVYVASGAMAGLAAIVYLARLNSAEADIGEPLTLPAVAAVLIGGTSLFGGLGTLSGTLVGAIILTLVLNGMNLLAINASWQPLVTGVVVILAVWIDILTRQRAEARA
jgi:ribose transport system permease protein